MEFWTYFIINVNIYYDRYYYIYFASTALSCLQNGLSLLFLFFIRSSTNNRIANAIFNIFAITLLIMTINTYEYMNQFFFLN